ncbi:MAG: hypothetical protein JKX87_06020 [Cycloclasticus sp.]|nr:hypothetical protein [Cycloclasticus sp.]
MKLLLSLSLFAIFSLLGCTDDGSATKLEAEKKTVFDGHINALDKTRNIENILQKSANERQEDLDEY